VKLLLEETYLYKFHLLTKGLDKFFDTELRKHANIGLSHFLILLTVRQHKAMSAKDIAAFLDVSPAAISRQVEGACQSEWLCAKASMIEGRGQSIQLTRKGEKQVRKGLRALEAHVFTVFLGGNRQMDLMSHIDVLLSNMTGNDL
jgi:DNA-binding MarR family transcriptional regulator